MKSLMSGIRKEAHGRSHKSDSKINWSAANKNNYINKTREEVDEIVRKLFMIKLTIP